MRLRGCPSGLSEYAGRLELRAMFMCIRVGEFVLAVALFGSYAAAAESDAAGFYRPPQLFVMTGFIANTTNGTWGTDFVGSGDWTPQKQLS